MGTPPPLNMHTVSHNGGVEWKRRMVCAEAHMMGWGGVFLHKMYVACGDFSISSVAVAP